MASVETAIKLAVERTTVAVDGFETWMRDRVIDVRFLHRRTGYLEWDDVHRVDWAAGIVHLRVNRLRRLSGAR